MRKRSASERKALADHRGRLQRELVARTQAVHARQHQALDGGWNAAAAALLGVAQQLLEEQRVALCPLDAFRGEATGGLDQAAGQRARFVGPQRPQVDGQERHAMAGRAPVPVEGIAFEAGGHRQHQRALARHYGCGGETVQQQRRRPVHVLEHQEPRPLARGVASEIGERRGGPPPARRIVHRVEDRTLVLALLQAEQIAHRHFVVDCNEARLQRAGQSSSPACVVRAARHSEQIGDHRGQGLLAFADTEVEHASQVARIALRAGAPLQFFDQPGLADPGLAADHHRCTGGRVAHAVEHTGKLPQLGVAADHRKAFPRPVAQRRDAVHAHRLVEALERLLAQVFSVHAGRHAGMDRLRYQRIAGAGERIESGGQVHRFTGDRVLRLGAA